MRTSESEGTLAIYDSSAVFGFEVPMRAPDWTIGTSNPPHYALKRIPKGSRQERKGRARDEYRIAARRMNRRDFERNQGRRDYPDFWRRRNRRIGAWARQLRSGCSQKPLSFLEIRVDLFGHLIDREVAHKLLAIDEKSRRRIDPELLGGMVADLLDAVEELLIRQALVEVAFGNAELLGDILQGRQRFLDHPLRLFGEQRLDHRHVFVLAAAPCQHESGGCERIKGERT